MTKIKFGTDGWRAIIAKEYTTDNVARVAEATAKWMIERGMKKVVIGYDCRFGGTMFTDVATQVFGKHGLHIVRSTGFVSTPMISLVVVKENAGMGVVITASHNPASYNGYKLKSAYGGPTIPKDIQDVEDMIADTAPQDLPTIEALEENGQITTVDMEQMYLDHIYEHFDLDLIKTSGVNLAYDAMYGAGQNVIKRIFPDAHLLHCAYNPSFMGQAPEPIARNLKQIAEDLANNEALNLGLANDGDADRIGMFDGDGNFVDSHHILLLLLYYLHEHKGMNGKVIITFSVTDKMRKLAELYGLECEVTKIGFKYIAEIMTEEDVLVGGEESGGLAVKGHIPERDGIWIGLVIMEFMAKTGKSINELIQDVYDKVGEFATDRDDLHIDNEKKWAIMDKCKNGEITKIGDRLVIRTESVDGYKFYLSEDDWVMIRPSGTEPVLRVYSQSSNAEGARAILDAAHVTLK
ncbi:MAG: phosphoglucomutase/phosphomannomutase family protein [Saprospiraceae bacterium]|nr:phosphoglucomutase/phosphomannomutase family protein [Saprospiraceae bacterium]